MVGSFEITNVVQGKGGVVIGIIVCVDWGLRTYFGGIVLGEKLGGVYV